MKNYSIYFSSLNGPEKHSNFTGTRQQVIDHMKALYKEYSGENSPEILDKSNRRYDAIIIRGEAEGCYSATSD